tara:strand:+ start:73 stop:414 length:342 start_codon:yes stop_codon:yes gene_type:complete
MTVYFIAQVQTDDPEGYMEYVKAGRPTLIEHGAWYVGRASAAGDAEVIEGDDPGRYIIIGFENRESVWKWYNSPEYQEAKKIRDPISKVNLFIVDEIPPGSGIPTRPLGDIQN